MNLPIVKRHIKVKRIMREIVFATILQGVVGIVVLYCERWMHLTALASVVSLYGITVRNKTVLPSHDCRISRNSRFDSDSYRVVSLVLYVR